MQVVNDINLNYSRVLQIDAANELTQQQINMTALAVAYALNAQDMINDLETKFAPSQQEAVVACKTAAIIMQMNNIYYRSVHLIADSDLSALPAGLRMQSMLKPGVAKLDFELMATAVSALNGCGMCLKAHTATLKKSGVSTAAIAHLLRIASVLNAKASMQHLTAMQDSALV